MRRVVDEAKRACVRPISLDRDFGFLRAEGLRRIDNLAHELGDDVLEAHVGAIDIMWPENQHALKIFTAVIDRHHFADQLAGAI